MTRPSIFEFAGGEPSSSDVILVNHDGNSPELLRLALAAEARHAP